MDFIKQPMEIENRSMEIIAPYLAEYKLSEAEIKVYSRMIHASGDVDYAKVIRVHPQAIEAMQQALKKGAHIYTDVEMVRTGINKKKLASFGGEVHCLVADEKIAVEAKAQGITRSMAAMRSFGKALDGAIIAIGNAPTALFEVWSKKKAYVRRPSSASPSVSSGRQIPRNFWRRTTKCRTSRWKARRAAVRSRRPSSMLSCIS